MATKQVFTIAISGCSSAGKTTLALLLSEIFADLSVDGSCRLLLLFYSVVLGSPLGDGGFGDGH